MRRKVTDHGGDWVSGHGVPQVAASETVKRTSVREPARSPQDAVPRDRLRRKPRRDRGEAGPEVATTTMIWGVHPVSELLRRRPQLVMTVYLATARDDARGRAIAELATQERIRIEFGLPPEQSEITAHQGVAALIKTPTPLSLNELLSRLGADEAPPTPPLLLMLDSIQDPHNLGAAIRSAAAFGVAGVIIPKDRSAQITGTVLKSAAGTLPLVEICQTTNLVEALQKLKEHGFWIYGAAGEATTTIYQSDLSGPICLVVGNEQKGIRPLLRRHCDFLISIPLAAGVESLNVSVAAGIILAEIRRKSLPRERQSSPEGFPDLNPLDPQG